MVISETVLERRRVETWIAIHQAAATLALKDGLALATVDAIAAKAGVSRRTFFNYFQTKEDAVLGLELPQLTEEALAQFQAVEDDVLSGLVRFMVTVSLTASRLSPDTTARRQLIQRFPELRLRIQHSAGVAEAIITPVLHEKLGIAPGDGDTSVKALQMLAGTIMRFAFSQHSNPTTITHHELEIAIATFRDVLKDIR